MTQRNSEDVPLPSEFGDFAPFAHWALPTQSARRHHRIHESSLEDLLALYEFGLATGADGRTRIEEALEYLDRLPLGGMPEDAQQLFYILLSMAEISVSVEAWGEVLPEHAELPERFPPTPRTDVL